ncbi:MAG TPA: response regulator [Paraburkholderia sp.]|jgi:signal transduction histidine kinase/DNA-binding response OmpR family regulator/CHASE3 domain sensor protein|uniref:response regulator n=1 Tax=Paraburkholderia sp. TaxID=1926495 RepID=UPI002DF24CB2|nr:response regulator [Paraburkholderia sp.]
MPALNAIDPLRFKRIIQRNVALPLLAGFATAVAFVALIAYLVSTMNWAEHSERVIGEAYELLRVQADRESSLRGFLLDGDERGLAPFEVGRAHFGAQVGSLSALVIDNPPQVERLKRILALAQQWDKSASEAVRLRRDHDAVLATVQNDKAQPNADALRREFADFLAEEGRLREARTSAARNLTFITVAVFLALTVFVNALLAWLGRRELTALSATYDDALRGQAEQGDALAEQVWFRSGQRLLAESGMGKEALAEVGGAMLDCLAGYLSASVATLYVRDAHDASLRRVATFGFGDESGYNVPMLQSGQTLVGQAAASRRVIELRDAPAGYLKVESGLGSATPTSLLISPIDATGQINGVVELAFMRALLPRDTEFLTRVAGTMGDLVEAAVSRERLQVAYADAQQLNHELQVQQEELRVANEGLEERGRALMDSQSRLEAQQVELEQTNVQLEEYARRLETQKSELERAQGELTRNAERLAQSSRYKSEFLANMSHELRTPLNSSLILAKLLQQNRTGNLSEEQVRYAATIHASNTDLLALINDILDLSKVEAGQVQLMLETVKLDDVTASLHETFAPLAREKHVALTIDRLPGVADTLTTDGQRVLQILRNLLSNALKFTAQGEVSLTVSPVDANVVRFDVRDTGIGIPEDKLEMIFEAFQQADGSTSREYGGSGLGLSISRELSRLLGGRIGVASEPGVGSVFTLWLPLDSTAAARLAQAEDAAQAVVATPHAAAASNTARAQPAPAETVTETTTLNADARAGQAIVAASAPTAHAAHLADDRGGRQHGSRAILVIEDDLTFAEILRDLVHELQFDFLHAADAATGFAMVKDEAPVAVLLDVGLPDRSGLSVLEWLKSDPLTRHIPVHIVSATDHADKALHLGAIGYTLKPTARSTLEAAIRRLESRLEQRVKRVLVIEDDYAMRESIRALLVGDGVEIVAVGTLADAHAQIAQGVFDCIVTDLTLPDGTGYDLLETLAGDAGVAPLPVIVYTGRMLSDDDEQRLRRYSKSIIIKGARSPERLLDEVTLFLHSVESSLAPEQQRMLRAVRQRDDTFEGKTILLAEDDVRNIFALSHVIEPLGAKLLIARNGREALDILGGQEPVDLVLMDVMMPEMDGLAAMRALRSDARYTHAARLPVIALTAKAMADDRQRCLEAGADDYVSKPIDVDKLVSLCRVWLRK